MLRISAPPLLLYGAYPSPPLREFESRKFGFTLDQKAVRPYLGLKVGQDYEICLGGNSDIPTVTGKWKTGTLLSVKKGVIILEFKTGAKKINLRGFTNLIRPAPRKKSL